MYQPILSFNEHRISRGYSSGDVTGESAVTEFKRKIEAEIALAHYELLRLQEEYEQLKESRRRIDLFAELAQAKEQSGTTGPIERVRWQVERLTMTERLIGLRTQVRAAGKQLSLLSGHGGYKPVVADGAYASSAVLVNEYPARPFADSDDAVNNSMSRLVQLAINRSLPDTKRLTTHSGTTGLRSRGYFPQVGFEAGVRWNDSLADLNTGFTEQTPEWSARFRFDWSLTSLVKSGLSSSNSRSPFGQARFGRDIRSFQLAAKTIQVGSEWLASLERLPISEEGTNQANYLMNEITGQYLAGEEDYEGVRGTLELWTERRLSAIQRRYNYFEKSVQLLELIGGSTIETNGTPGERIFDLLSR